MIMFLKLIAAAVLGYLLGNISCGMITAKLFGNIDIRKHGSGNAGTTNVLRTLGWLPSVITLLGDALKAFLAAKLGALISGDAGLLVGGLCAVAGHNWPVFFGFHGGKGIAPSCGMIFAINPLIALLLLLGQILVVASTGLMSLASICSAVLYPVWTAVFMHSRQNFVLFLIFSLFAAILAVYSHRENIKRLRAGTENRLNFSKIHFLEKLSFKKKH